jgi:hypothetical protein
VSPAVESSIRDGNSMTASRPAGFTSVMARRLDPPSALRHGLRVVHMARPGDGRDAFHVDSTGRFAVSEG